MTELLAHLFPYFVATLAFAALIFGLHRRSVNEEMRADYRLRTQTQTERAELEAKIESLVNATAEVNRKFKDHIEKLENEAKDRDAKITEEFRDNDQKLQNRIATAENILSSRKFG